MNNKIIYALPLAVLGLSACHEINTPDGRIPAQYVKQAQQYQGTYQGQFRGVPTKVGIYVSQDKPYVVVQNQRNNDLIGAKCNSQVGQLASVQGAQNQAGQAVLQTAKFKLNPGKCGQSDQVLRMDISQDQRVIQARVQQTQQDNTHDSGQYDGQFVREE